MPYCSNCGNEVEKNDEYCNNCGYKLKSDSNNKRKNLSNLKKFSFIFIGVIVAIVLVGFIVNTYIGMKMEDEINDVLSKEIRIIEGQQNNEISINYGDIKVNPLFRKINISDLSLKSNDSYLNLEYNTGEISLKTSYDNLQKLINEKPINKLETFSINLDKSNIFYESKWNDVFIHLGFDEISVAFDGQLSKEIGENPNVLLYSDQNIDVVFKGAELYSDEFENEYGTAEAAIINKFTNYDEISFSINHDSGSKQFKIKDIKITNSFLDFYTNFVMQYKGNNFENITPVNYQIGNDFNFTVRDLSWGNANDYGKFTLDKLELQTDSENIVDISNYDYYSEASIPEGKFNLSVNGFDVELKGKAEEDYQKLLRYEFGIKTNDIPKIEVDELKLNYFVKNNNMEIDSQLDSSILDANLVGNIDINQKYFDDSKINQLKLEIIDYHDIFKPMVGQFERVLGNIHDGENIVLNFKGRIGRPQLQQ